MKKKIPILKIVFVIPTIIIAAAVCIGIGGAKASEVDPAEQIPYSHPADPNASETAKALYTYLTALSRGDKPGVISGQNCYHGNQITAEHQINGYRRMIEDLHKESGQWVGIIGEDYEHDQIFSSEQLSQANKYLIDYAQKGGWVTINWAPLNPWISKDNGKPVTLEKWNGKGSTRDLSDVNLYQLIDPQSEVYSNWRTYLDRIAGALSELQDAGVVVLWRPMQEMNGSWFWWGMKSHPNDPEAYRVVWRDMFRYFTEEKGLHNLLWVYSPNFGGSNRSNWNRSVDWAYPGDDYVDIVAGTSYDDRLDFPDYRALLKFGKPMGIAEYGPKIGGRLAANGTLDCRLYGKRLGEDYPAVAYWVSWHSWPGENWSLVTNKHTRELLESDFVLTRDELPKLP